MSSHQFSPRVPLGGSHRAQGPWWSAPSWAWDGVSSSPRLNVPWGSHSRMPLLLLGPKTKKDTFPDKGMNIDPFIPSSCEDMPLISSFLIWGVPCRPPPPHHPEYHAYSPPVRVASITAPCL